MTLPAPQQPNTFGTASLALGIATAGLVFGIGLCMLVGAQQGCSCAGRRARFVGLIGAAVGAGGWLGSNRSKATAIVGLILGLVGVCLFFLVLLRFRG